MKKVTPGRWFELISVTVVVFTSGWYLKTVADGIDQAEQRRDLRGRPYVDRITEELCGLF